MTSHMSLETEKENSQEQFNWDRDRVYTNFFSGGETDAKTEIIQL